MYKKHHMIISCDKKKPGLARLYNRGKVFIGSDLLQHHLHIMLNVHLHTSHRF